MTSRQRQARSEQVTSRRIIPMDVDTQYHIEYREGYGTSNTLTHTEL